jgi:hypothetical protein
MSWVRDHSLWKHINEHARHVVWPAVCGHLLCDDSIADEHALWQHLVDNHGLSRSRPDAVRSRKRKSSDEPEIVTWTPEHGPSSLRRKINPRVLSKPTPAGYHVDETEYLTNTDSDETPLNGCMTGVVDFPQLKTTDTCSADDNLLSPGFLQSPSPSHMSIGEFSGSSSDTAVDSGTDGAIPTLTAKPPSSALGPDAVRADGQPHADVKPIRIRLRVNPPPKRPQETNIILRRKGPKLGKGDRERRKKARRSG